MSQETRGKLLVRVHEDGDVSVDICTAPDAVALERLEQLAQRIRSMVRRELAQ